MDTLRRREYSRQRDKVCPPKSRRDNPRPRANQIRASMRQEQNGTRRNKNKRKKKDEVVEVDIDIESEVYF